MSQRPEGVDSRAVRFARKRAQTDKGEADSGGHDTQAHVRSLRRVCEQANRNEIDARLGVGANVFQADSARALHWDGMFKFRTTLHRAPDVFCRHVVQQNRFSTVSQRIFQLAEVPHFHLDGLRTAPVSHSALQDGHDSAGQRNVIVLDEHSVGEIEPVILSAAAAHSILVDHSQPRCGFARIENSRFRARDSVHELPREGSDSAHALYKVQDHALARKNHARIMTDHRDRLSFVQPYTVKDLGMRGHFVVRSHGAIERGVDIEDARYTTDASQNAIFFGEDGGRRALVGIDAGIAGGIARGPVFEQRVLQDRGDASGVKVHKTVASDQWPVASLSASGSCSIQFVQLAL